MRTATLFSLTLLGTLMGSFAIGCSSSETSPGTPADTGSGADTSVTDTGGGDTKADTKTETGKSDTAKPDTGPSSCDPIKMTGCTAPDTKCTALDDGTGTSVKAGCVAPTGTKATGDSCARTSQDPSGIGHDDCAGGNYCSGIGSFSSPAVRHCRKFCGGDSACATTEKCSVLLSDSAGPTAGICVPTCTLFGTDCASGLNCSLLISDFDGVAAHGTCRAVGTKAAGATCTMAYECAKDLICSDPTKSGTTTCIPLCDATHACTSGTCKTGGGLPGTTGICQ